MHICFSEQVTCTYDTNKSHHPCSMCMCRAEALSNVEAEVTHIYRTETSMKRIYEQMQSQPPTMRERTSKTHSLHPVEVIIFITV